MTRVGMMTEMGWEVDEEVNQDKIGEADWSDQKKLAGCKNGTDLLYHHAKYGGDCGSRAGWDEKVWCFLPVCHALEL